MEKRKNKIIISWLWVGLILVVFMVAIGGITRLTHSGLSMVEWKLISGSIPPLNELEWEEAFVKYQQFPEYQEFNNGMKLDEFKSIFFWEYLHRTIGRLIGIIFILPFGFFVFKGWVRGALGKKLIGLLLLGALQGGLGWFMVKSGLVDRPSVSHFRLAIHLIAAFSLFVYIFWLILELKGVKRVPAPKVRNATGFMLVLVTLQIVYGAFTAGLKAGSICPTFPDMCGSFFSPTIETLDFFNDPSNIQFIHRCLGWLVLLTAFFLWKKVKNSEVDTKAGSYVLIAIGLQFLLGVTTLLLHVPIAVAVIHQLGAVLVLFTLTHLLLISSWPSKRNAMLDLDVHE